MNLQNVVAFVDENSTTIVVKYPRGDQGYTFRASKALANDLAPGDWVVVESKNGLGVCEVIRVDGVSQVDVDAPFTYAWAFQRVERATLEALKAADARTVEELTAQRREAMRTAMRAQLAQGDGKFLLGMKG